jgi:hypothetical protein
MSGDTKFSALPLSDGGTFQATANYDVAMDAGAAQLKPAGGLLPVNDQTGTTYTLGLGDIGKDVRCTNAAAIALTVPANATTAFPIGTLIVFSQGGAGAVTATAASGVTLRTPYQAATTVQYDARVLEKIATDEWRVW